MKAAPGAVGFGPHLVFHGFGCPAQRAGDLDGIYHTLDSLPDRIGMTKIMPPYVFRNVDDAGRMRGCSGFVLIAESHISIHAFPERRIVSADIFSCSPFDVEDAVRALREAFRPRRVEWRLLDRGREFPRDIAGSRAVVEIERRQVASGLGLEALR